MLFYAQQVRVAGYEDRGGIQQALDLGADGILIPYINTAEEAAAGVSCCLYPTAGTRSVYFPQRSMNKAGLLGYAGVQNDNVIIALQVETADCIKNMEAICKVPRVDMLFLGQNDLCMSMGLFGGQYEFPKMYTSPELKAATDKLISCAKAKDILLGMFQVCAPTCNMRSRCDVRGVNILLTGRKTCSSARTVSRSSSTRTSTSSRSATTSTTSSPRCTSGI